MKRRGALLFVILLFLFILSNSGLTSSTPADGLVCCFQNDPNNYCQYIPQAQCLGYNNPSLNEFECTFTCDRKDCCLDSCSQETLMRDCSSYENFEFGGVIGCDNPYKIDDYPCDIGCCVYKSGNIYSSCVEEKLRKECNPEPPNSDNIEFHTGVSGNSCNQICNGTYQGPSYGKISGYVKNPSENKIANVNVISEGIISNTNPYLLENVPSGTQKVTASAPGYLSSSKTVDVISGSTIEVNFTLQPSTSSQGNLEGYVKNSSGSPIKYAIVKASCTGCNATTNAMGYYKILNIPTGTKTFTAEALNYITSPPVDMLIEDAKTKKLNFTLTLKPLFVCGDLKIDPGEDCEINNDNNCKGYCKNCLCPSNCIEAKGSNDYCADFLFQCLDSGGTFIEPFPYKKNLCSIQQKAGCCTELPKPVIECKDNSKITTTAQPNGYSGDKCYCKSQPAAYYTFLGTSADPGYCCEGNYNPIQCLPKGIITGYVYDKKDNAILVGAKILIGKETAYTDSKGKYLLNMDQGIYTISASFDKYHPDSAEVSILSAKQTNKNFYLEKINVTCLMEEGLPAAVLSAKAVKGKPYVDLSWTQICRDYINNFFIYRSVNNGPFEPIGIITDKLTSTFRDQNTGWRTSYTYRLETFPNDFRPSSFSNDAQITTGSSICEDKGNNQFCTDKNLDTKELLVLRSICDDNNNPKKMDITGADCSNIKDWPLKNGYSAFCLELSGITFCQYPDDCPSLGVLYDQYLPGPINVLGMYYNGQYNLNKEVITCEKKLSPAPITRRYCYYDYYSKTFLPNTITNKCINCEHTQTCYDYKSVDACNSNNCLVNQKCRWFKTQNHYSEFGRGICYSENYTKTDQCGKCNKDNPLFSNVDCTSDLCRKLGACYSLPDETSPDKTSCVPCSSAITCEDLPDEISCIGTNPIQPIQFAGSPQDKGVSCNSSTVISRSRDNCNIGTCRWNSQDSACIKDGNVDNKADNAGLDLTDNIPPVTELSSETIINSGGKSINVHVSDNKDTANALTFYCVGKEPCCPVKQVRDSAIFLSKEDFGEVDGIFNIYYYSIDSNQNVEEIKSKQIYVNALLPVASIFSKTLNNSLDPFTSDLYINISSNKSLSCSDYLTVPDYVLSSQPSNNFIVGPNNKKEVLFDNYQFGLPDGSYVYTLYCDDIYGNHNEQNFDIVIDRVSLIYDKLPNSTTSEQIIHLSMKTKSDQFYCRYFIDGKERIFNPDFAGLGQLVGDEFYYESSESSLTESKVYNAPIECYDILWNEPNARLMVKNNFLFAVDRKAPLTKAINAYTNNPFDETLTYKSPSIRLECDDKATFDNPLPDAYKCQNTYYCIDDSSFTTPCSPYSWAVYDPSYPIQDFYATGKYYLRFQSEDEGYNLEEVRSIIINIDQEPPELTLTYPPEYFVTDQNNIDVKGTTGETGLIIIKVRVGTIEKYAAVTPKNQVQEFFVNMPLSDGENIIEVYSSDSSGNTYSISTTVYKDVIGPEVYNAGIMNSYYEFIQDINSGLFSEYLTPITFFISGSDERYSGYYYPYQIDQKLTVNLTVRCQSATCGSDGFSQSAFEKLGNEFSYVHQTPLKVGNYSASLILKDRFGNPTETNLNFSVIDTTSPTINISIIKYDGNIPKIVDLISYGEYDIYINSSEPIKIDYLNFSFTPSFTSENQNKPVLNLNNSFGTSFRGKVVVHKSDPSYQGFDPSGEWAEFMIGAYDTSQNPVNIETGSSFRIDIVGPFRPEILDPQDYFEEILDLRRVVTKNNNLVLNGVSDGYDPNVKVHLYYNTLPNINPANLEITTLQKIGSKQVMPEPTFKESWTGNVEKVSQNTIQIKDQYEVFQINQQIELQPLRYNKRYYKIVNKKLDHTTPNGEKFYNLTLSDNVEGTLDSYQTIYRYDQSQQGPPGWFEFSYILKEGINNFIVYPEDPLYNLGYPSQVYQISYDNTAPKSTNKFPYPNTIIGDNEITIKMTLDGTGSYIRDYSLSMYLVSETGRTWVDAYLDPPYQNKQNLTSTPLALNNGKYKVEIIYEDEAGNNNSESWNFTVDTSAPSQPLITPAATNNRRPIISIEFNESENIALNSVIMYSATNSFEKDISNSIHTINNHHYVSTLETFDQDLSDDTYLISVKAQKVVDTNTLALGSEAEFTQELVIDSTPPIISSLTNSQGTAFMGTNQKFEKILIQPEDEPVVYCRWDYEKKSFDSMPLVNNFSTENFWGEGKVQNKVEGNNTFFVLCMDPANNVMPNHLNITFNYDTTIPALIINQPHNNAIFKDELIEVNGTSEPGANLKLYVNGELQDSAYLSNQPAEEYVSIKGNLFQETKIVLPVGSTLFILNDDGIERSVEGYINSVVPSFDTIPVVFNTKGTFTIRTIGSNSNTLTVEITDYNTNFKFNAYLFSNQNNEIIIKASDPVDNNNSVNIFVKHDSEPPTIDSVSPLQDSLTNNVFSKIKIDVSDNNKIEYSSLAFSVDGIPKALIKDETRGHLEFIPSPLEPWQFGVHDVQFNVSDIAGNVNEFSWQFTVEEDIPALTAFYQCNSIGINYEDSYPIKTNKPCFYAYYEVPVTLETPNSYFVPVNGLPRWFLYNSSISMSEGRHEASLTVYDEFGNYNTKTLSFVIDSVAPVINDQTDRSLTNSESIKIHGSIVDANLDYVEVDGVAATLTGNDYLIDRPLYNDFGNNTFEIIAFDKAGNKNNKTITIPSDRINPNILNLIISPSQTKSQFKVIFESSEKLLSHNIKVEDNGQDIGGTYQQSSSNNIFTYIYTVPTGEFSDDYDLLVNLTDLASNSVIFDENVKIDTIRPAIKNILPNENAFINDVKPMIKAEFEDWIGINISSVILRLDQVKVTNADGSLSIDENGLTYIPNSPLADLQQHNVVLQLSDNVGNTAEKSWAFTVDTSTPTPPSFKPNTYTSENKPLIEVKFSSNEIIKIDEIILNGQMLITSPTTSPFSYTPANPLSDGISYIEVSASKQLPDGTYGTIGNYNYEFTVDTVKPTVSVSALDEYVNTNLGKVMIDYGDENINSINVEVKLGTAVIRTETLAQPLAQPPFNYEFQMAANGIYTLKVKAIDKASNFMEDTATITKSTTPPTLVVTEPINNKITNDGIIKVKGSSELGTLVELFIDGKKKDQKLLENIFTEYPIAINGFDFAIKSIDVPVGGSVILQNQNDQDIAISGDIQITIPLQQEHKITFDSIGQYTYNTLEDALTINVIPQSTSFEFSSSLDEKPKGNSIAVRSTNKFENKAEVNLKVYYDTQSPVISNMMPWPDSITNRQRPQITADYSDTNGINTSSVVLKVDSKTIDPSLYSIYQDHVKFIPQDDLEFSVHNVYLSVSDRASNFGEAGWQFKVDPNIPTLIGFFACSSSDEVSEYTFTKIDKPCFIAQYMEEVVLDGPGNDFIPIQGSSKSFIFNSTSPMAEGPHMATLTVKDEFGNTNTNALHFIIDKTPPIINDYTNKLLTNAEYITIQGKIDDNNLDYVEVGGIKADLIGNDYSIQSFLENVNGINTFDISAFDKAGNRNNISISIPVDRILPAVTDLNIQPSQTNNRFTVSFRSSESLAGYNLKVGNNGQDLGGTLQKSSSGNIYTLVYTIPFGGFSNDYGILIEATDPAGNLREVNSIIKIDTIFPTIIRINPPDGVFTNDQRPTIIAEFEDWTGIKISSVKLKIDGLEVTNAQGSLSIDENGLTYIPNSPLADLQQHNVVLQLSDNVGNTAEKSWAFTVDTSTPTPPSFKPNPYTSENKPLIEVMFSSSEVVKIYDISLDGVEQISDPKANSYSFIPANQLADGIHTLQISASKQLSDGTYGLIGKYSYEFVVDTAPPSLSVVPVNTIINTDAGEIIIDYFDNNIDMINIEVKLDSLSIDSKTFSRPIEQSPFNYKFSMTKEGITNDGVYNIKVKALDKAANFIEKITTITRNTEQPIININSITNPSIIKNTDNSYLTSLNYLDIEGTISYASTSTISGTEVSIFLNNVEKNNVIVGEAGAFSFKGISQLEKTINTITIKAVSPAGVMSETSFKVSYSTQQPTITFISPITHAANIQTPTLEFGTDIYSICNISYTDDANQEYKSNLQPSNNNLMHAIIISNTNKLKQGDNSLKVSCRNAINLFAKEIFIISIDTINPKIMDVRSIHGDEKPKGTSDKAYLLYKSEQTSFTIASDELTRCWYGLTQDRSSMAKTKDFDDSATAYKIEHQTDIMAFPDKATTSVYFICEDKAGNIGPTYKLSVEVLLNMPLKILSKKPEGFTKEKRPVLEVITDRNASCIVDKAEENIVAFIFDKFSDLFKVGNVLMEKRFENNKYIHTVNTSSSDTYFKDLDEDTQYIFDVMCNPVEQGVDSASDQIIFKTDFQPPFLEINMPQNGFMTSNPIIMIKGNASPQADVEVFVNGIFQRKESLPPSSTQKVPFTTTGLLSSGVNSISIVAYDQIRNSVTVALYVVFANIGPIVESIYPNNNDTVNSLSTATATLKSLTDASLDMAGSSIGLFDINSGLKIENVEKISSLNTIGLNILNTLSDGQYKLIVIPKDSNGNIGEPKVSIFTIDSSVPVIILETPKWYGSTYNKNKISFKGTISSFDSPTSITGQIIGDGISTPIGQAFNKDIPFLDKDGIHLFTIEAKSSSNKKTARNGYLAIDTKGPEACIIIDGDMSCYKEPSNTLDPNTCGNGICEASNNCVSDCVIPNIDGFSNLGSKELLPNTFSYLFFGTSAPNPLKGYQVQYYKASNYYSVYVGLFVDTDSASVFDAYFKSNKQLIKTQSGTFEYYSSGDTAMWQSNNKVIIIQSESGPNIDLINAYSVKYPK